MFAWTGSHVNCRMRRPFTPDGRTSPRAGIEAFSRLLFQVYPTDLSNTGPSEGEILSTRFLSPAAATMRPDGSNEGWAWWVSEIA